MLFKAVYILILMAHWDQLELTVNGQEDPLPAGSYVTCDFDILNDQNRAEILELLPTECQEIYYDPNQQSRRQQMEDESFKFEEFMNVLALPEYVDDSDEISNDWNWDLRNDTYTIAQLHECSNETTTEIFFDCLMERRQVMIDNINETKVSNDRQ